MPSIPSDNRILYFARDREVFRFLSHFYPSPITLDRLYWPTVAHYYQAPKSDDPAYRAAVRAAAALPRDRINTPRHSAGPCSALNQALMELGATVCTPKAPHCEACPMATTCRA